MAQLVKQSFHTPKDPSLNRVIWNFFLGPKLTIDQARTQDCAKYLLTCALVHGGLKNQFSESEFEKHSLKVDLKQNI